MGLGADLLTLEEGSCLLLRHIPWQAVKHIEQQLHEISTPFVVHPPHQLPHQLQTSTPEYHIPDIQVFEKYLADQARLSVTLRDQGVKGVHHYGHTLVVALGHSKANVLLQIQWDAILQGNRDWG